MKFNVENYLYAIDQALSQKSERDKNMLFLILFSSLFAFSYLFFWDSAEASFKKSHDEALAMGSSLTNDQQYLEANPPERITQIEAETKAIEVEHQHYIGYNTYIKDRLDQISYLYYDESVRGVCLADIAKYARIYNVKLNQFGNAPTPDTNSSFGHVLDISISSDGDYKSTLKFMNMLEQSDLVIDLHTINMFADKKLKSDLKLSVWGIVRQ